MRIGEDWRAKCPTNRMPLRILRKSCTGPDVIAIQDRLNREGETLVPDGAFGNLTDAAVRRYQAANQLDVDGEVGPKTRYAMYPLMSVAVNVLGIRGGTTGSNSVGSVSKISSSPSLLAPLTLPPLRLPPLNAPGPTELISVPGLPDKITAPSTTASATRGTLRVDWQQIAQTQRQFTGLFKNPQDTFAVGVQGVFKRSEDDGHVELATGCLLQSPIGITDPKGNAFTIACFAQGTWVDPLGTIGAFHLWSPFASIQGQANTSPGPANPTLQVGAFPLNLGVDLDSNGLQLTLSGGPVWNLIWKPDGVQSVWGSQIGLGLSGKIRILGN